MNESKKEILRKWIGNVKTKERRVEKKEENEGQQKNDWRKLRKNKKDKA